jgi:hypothetical protein
MATIPVTSGLQLLLDARTITGSDGDAIAAWADQSGLGNNAAQSTLANRPLYKTNIFGSNPAVRFVDSTDFMSGAFASWGTHVGQTVLLMLNNVTAPRVRVFSTTANTGEDFQHHLLYFGGTNGSVFVYQNDVAIKTTVAPNAVLAQISGITSPVIIGYAVTGTRMDYVCNGILGFNQTISAGLPATQTKYCFGLITGGNPTGGQTPPMDVHFAIVFNRRLTAIEIEQVCCWMRTEIGLLPESGGTAGFTGLSGLTGRLGT